MKGYVKQVRDDQKLDIRLSREVTEQIPADSEKILLLLKEHKGVLPAGDKSNPEEIYQLCQMSKKAFKRAIGSLYKQKLIKIDPKAVTLI